MTENWLLSGLALAYALVSVARIPTEENMLRRHFGVASYDVYKTRVTDLQIGLAVSGLVFVHVIGAVLPLF
jgi:protein-S-isoprenylcysteine O-methyltransferase Ste14